MTKTDLPSAGHTRKLRHAETNRSAVSIASDFAALIAIFERQLELLSSSDSETKAHLARAKIAAERGAKLSQQLIEQTRRAAKP
jgi:1,2-phenylacetyl-CoA epoxidase catalytic subunit